jgi:putative membrane protein insertion efficiency factor
MRADVHGFQSPGLNAAQRLALMIVRAYQLLFSPLFAGSCRFTPSCSRYAAEAIERFGVVRGSYLAIRRLARCHPFGAHGADPVPDFAAPRLRRGKPEFGA